MAVYFTRIFVKVDQKELMDKLCELDIGDLGKGFYKAGDIFKTGSLESNFHDTESGINEGDLQTLVERVVAIINGHGMILADTYSYDYDPYPQACYYDGNEIVSKLLNIYAGAFEASADITNPAQWIRFVEETEEYDAGEDWDDEDEDWDDEDWIIESETESEGIQSSDWSAPVLGLDQETLRDVFGITPDKNGFAVGNGTLYGYFGNSNVVVVPDGISQLAAGCFAGNTVIEDVTLPDSLEAMDMCCFMGCPNLRKVYIPVSVGAFGCDNSTFSKSPNLTIYAPTGSYAETYAKKNSITFVAE